MARKWSDVQRTLPPARETRIRKRVDAEMGRLPLTEMRRARMLTQDRLAEILHINQAAVSKLEKRSDMYLSTLRSYVEAIGGQLDVRAIFPNGEVVLKHLSDTAPEKPRVTRA